MTEKTYGAQQEAAPAPGEQPLSEAEKALVEEAYSRLRTYTAGCKEAHDWAKEGRRIALLDDPKQDLPGTPQAQRALQMQTLKSNLNNCIADQMDNMPEAVMLPETPQMQDAAEDLTDVVRFILAQNNYERTHRAVAEDLFVTGTAIRQVYWDEDLDHGRGNIGVLRWPVEAFLWDPVAENIQDARALIKVSWHPLSWYAAHYPEQAPYVAGEDYAHESVGVPEAWATKQPDDEDRAMLLEYWYRRYEKKTGKYSINVALLAGGALLDHMRDVYAHGLYPFIVDVYNRVEGLPVGLGMAQEQAPTMRAINRYYHYMDENMRMSSKPKLLINRHAKIDNDALTDYSKAIVEGDNIDRTGLQWLITPLFSSAPSAIAIQLQTDLKQDSGQNQFTRGETAGGVTAASAIASLQEAGGKQTRMRSATLNQGFQDMVEQIVWLVSEFFDEKTVRLITGKEGKVREVDMSAAHLFGKRKKGPLPPPPYSVQVQVQRRNPMRVQAMNELFIQAYSMAAQKQQHFPLTALFEILQVDGKDRIMPVLRQVEAEADMLHQAMAQMEQMAQGVEALQQENANLKEALMTQDDTARDGMYPGEDMTDNQLPMAAT